MKPEDLKTYYRRNLPHIQPIGGTFFVTFRLQDSIPKAQLFRLKQAYATKFAQTKRLSSTVWKEEINQLRNQFFRDYDALLDEIASGPNYLREPEVAKIVKEQMHRFDGELYDLLAYTIMPNHVHLLLDTSIQLPEELDVFVWEHLDLTPLNGILKRIKGASAVYANQYLGRSGKFWQRESYDHHVRSDKSFYNIISYILNNPVKAGIAENWGNYPFTYLKS